ncbi:hypothetical protein KRX51_07765 [Corynebacterium sp. TAE3-ERU12]|uniref:zinc ribbon domain-containing protein n=1 Tax=Corynebacterium sp. TAE3-ERU12 TaxID=2849491 RepID=UPI001C48B486|nr:hypothetical protein [Corynebacterium sp. TAE3-ERU12]MBV7295808.1 hypothetical protein [Corynebacterium sp. TAE3-ERU12]
MKIAPKTQLQLLELSESRTQLDGIAARRDSLPERAEYTKLQSEAARSRTESARSRLAAKDLGMDLRRLESDLDKLRRREADDRRTMRATEDEQARRDIDYDLRSTVRRREALERRIVEARDRRDAYDQHTTGATGDIEEQLSAARRALEAADDALLREQHELEQRLTALRRVVDEDLLAEFDRLEDEVGIAVVRLNGRQCLSCFMDLDPVTLREFAQLAVDDVAVCPECQAWVVRPETIAAAEGR